jgi:hypothetical protein
LIRFNKFGPARLHSSPSWPGEATKLCFAPMSRPSTSFFGQQSQDVDHRDKPGDDEERMPETFSAKTRFALWR